MTMEDGYYGRSMIKPPEWSDLIPAYFFVGGLAGASAAFAFTERLAKNDPLARALILTSAAGVAVSGYCLIADLKRPERFINMLRVFKPTSPMSMGVYLFSAFGGATTIAAAGELTGILRPIGRIFEGIAALLGPAMSVYTAVLISDTVVPAWHYGRTSMPGVFAATSAATAGAAGMLFAPAGFARPARRLALLGGLAMPLAIERLHMEMGPRQEEAYKEQQAGFFTKAAKLLNVAGLAAAVFAKDNGAAGKIAGTLLLASGLCERFGVFRAGCVSAKNPSYTIDAQRRRIGDRPQPQTPTRMEYAEITATSSRA
ncbi:MAG TPA: NrfD/PsrC family molybdoenzyme membrane anchor subunit [Candidatus Baltobacteraceae bacterium]|nr:NrfD/PsrC family molybdoenzyme membrane anchor subunit [Candidatus Baltobacteraceae bacterium]